MKNLILLLFSVAATVAVHAQQKQSLKDLLYGGKLKKDSTGVIRSTDDLSAKIDTSTKKEPQALNANEQATQQDKNAAMPKTDVNLRAMTNSTDSLKNEPDSTGNAAVASNTVPAKSNTRLLKEFTDSLVNIVQSEILKAKQIKKNTYYLMMDYEIGTDGQVAFTNVTSTPQNSYLEAQVRQILDSTPLHLTPVTDSNNQPKKVKRKQQFTITKE